MNIRGATYFGSFLCLITMQFVEDKLEFASPWVEPRPQFLLCFGLQHDPAVLSAGSEAEPSSLECWSNVTEQTPILSLILISG